MKSKKLFAILTLIAFMMTLVPMAAFAAFHDTDTIYSTSKSTVTVTRSRVEGYWNVASPEENAAKFTLTFKDSAGTKIADTAVVDFTIQISSELAAGWIDLNGNEQYDSGEEFTAAELYALASDEGLFFDNVELNDDSQVLVYFGATSSVSFDVKFFNSDEAGRNQFGSTKRVYVEKEEGAIDLKLYASESSNASELTKTGGVYDAIEAGTGFDIRADIGEEEDVEVTFKVKEEDGTWTVLGTADTDDDGVAALWYDGEKAGTFYFKAEAGKKDSAEVKITIDPCNDSDQLELSLKTANGKKVAVGDENSYVEFYVKDEFGNALASQPSQVVVSVTSAPADSDLKAQYDQEPLGNTGSDGSVKFTFEPDVAGKYVIKAQIAGERESVTIEVEAVEVDEYESLKFVLKNYPDNDTVTGLTRRYKPATENTNETNVEAGKLLVYGVANGAEIEIAASDLKFTSSNSSHVSVGNDGLIKLSGSASGTYQITVYYADDNLLGVYDLKVVGAPSAIKATPVVTGKTAAVTLQYVDANGNDTYANSKDGEIADEPYTVVVPAGLTVTDVKKINSAGKGTFNITASEAGTYKVTVLTGVKKIGASFDVTFGEEAKPASKVVTMFIGAPGYMDGSVAKVTDVAPFIVDGRTFVAVRPVAEAFGAEIGWNEATQTVTLTTADTTVTIVIGSNAITVVKNGVTSTVTADVAAFIKDGRTVLPFRAVGEAFGATVNYDAATQAVTYEI